MSAPLMVDQPVEFCRRQQKGCGIRRVLAWAGVDRKVDGRGCRPCKHGDLVGHFPPAARQVRATVGVRDSVNAFGCSKCREQEGRCGEAWDDLLPYLRQVVQPE